MRNEKGQFTCELPLLAVCLLYRFVGVHADLFTASILALEAHPAIDGGEQGVILADTNIIAGMKTRAPLAYNDAAGGYELTVTTL